jgi:hypothetical protein
MVILRPTRKLLPLLPESAEPGAASDTALGDWYVKRFVVDRRPLLLLVSARSLLPIVTPAREVRCLPRRLPSLVASRLRQLEIRAPLIDAECAAMEPVTIGRTIDRSVTGIMVDFAKCAPSFLEPHGWDDSSLDAVEDLLAETPCYASRPFEEVIFPDKRTPELLTEKWHAR